jgi:hypothetical protein
MRFLRSENGYALVLTLIFMPVFVGMSLLVIDISRGNNAHSDLQAAADALALAGARELDGAVDSMDRAVEAMTNVTNTVSFLGRTDEAAAITLRFAVGENAPEEFRVVFLSSMEPDDNTPLSEAFLTDNAVAFTAQENARFVFVRAQSRDLSPFFGLFFNGVNPVTDVPIAAQAVATYRTAACDVTPLFICNPFEGEAGTDNLQRAFADGRLHGRLVRLLPRGNGTAFPGNFGLLSSTEGDGNSQQGVNALRTTFATGRNRTCYDSRFVTTQPGRPAAIRTGINVRFDMYDGNMNGRANDVAYAPAANVRRGFIVDRSGNVNRNAWCQAVPTTNSTWTTRFPDNGPVNGIFGQMAAVPESGATIGSGPWDLRTYWSVNHSGAALPTDIPNSFPNAQFPGAPGPSRYDVYRYEIENGRSGDLSTGDGSRAGTRESGLPQCSNSATNPARDADRRLLFAAIINCNAERLAGRIAGRDQLRVNSFASIFLVSPMLQRVPRPDDDPNETINVAEDAGVIDIEIVDITGAGGNGTLDTFVRNEAILVR